VNRLTFPDYDVARATRYARIRRGLAIGQSIASLGQAAFFIGTGHVERLRQRIGAKIHQPEIADAVHLTVLSAETWALGLPERYISAQRIERHFGLSRRSDRAWLSSEITSLTVGTAFSVPLGTAALSVVRRAPEKWHIILPALGVPVQLAFVRLAPVLIFPRFNAFTPIESGELRNRINALADKAGIELGGVYSIDLSKQTERANAFFAGMGSTRRVVLGDTMLRSFQPAEIEGVVAHEIGHQVHGDLWRMSALNAAGTFAGAFALKWLAPRLAKATSRWTGTDRIDTSGSVPVWGLATGALAAAGTPLLLAYSRAVERRTDRYAIGLTENGQAYAGAMNRLMRQNLDEPYPPRWWTILFRSHPPTGERIEAALGRVGTGSSVRRGYLQIRG
jgi:STE24 endopeptidase